MEEWQIQSASSIISKAFEVKEYVAAPKAVRYEIASGNLREDFPGIVRKLDGNGPMFDLKCFWCLRSVQKNSDL